jgi:4-amino-4-deoxy-L-arabinose transferase-like glycosyltransferase
MSEPRTTLQQSPGPLAAFPPARWMIVLACCLIAGLYLGGMGSRWEPTPDSALYLSLGRSIAQGQGYQFNGQPNNTVTPGLPWVLAGLRSAFGESMLPANLFIVLCALAALWFIHKSILLWSDRRTALAVVIGTAGSYAMFYNSHCVLTDLPFVLLFWSMLYCCLRGLRGSWAWLLPAAALSAAGIVMRAPGALLIGPFAAGLILDRGPAGRRLASSAGALAPAAGTGLIFLWLARHVSTQTPAYIEGSVGNFWASNRLGQLLQGAANLPDTAAEMFTGQHGLWMLPAGIAILVIAAIGLCVLWKKGQRSITAVLVSYPILLTLLGGYPSVRPRYLVPILPMLIYACVEGLCWIVRKFQARRGATNPRTALLAVNIFIAAVVVSNFPKNINQAILVHRGDYYHELRRGQHEDLMKMAEILGPNVSPGASIALQDGSPSLFYYVAQKRVELLPVASEDKDNPPTGADADRTLKVLRERPDLKYIVLHISSRIPDKDRKPDKPDNAAFWDRLEKEVRALSGAEVIYAGKSLVVLRRA